MISNLQVPPPNLYAMAASSHHGGLHHDMFSILLLLPTLSLKDF